MKKSERNQIKYHAYTYKKYSILIINLLNYIFIYKNFFLFLKDFLTL